MTELIAGTHVASTRRDWPLRAALIMLLIGLLFFSMAELSVTQPVFHFGFSDQWPDLVIVPAALALAIGSAFVFARFSFGYFAGFYLFTMMAGYFWLNTFSVLDYDHADALVSAADSIVLFLLPALAIRAPLPTIAISDRLFDLMPIAILCFAALVLIMAASSGFHFVDIYNVAELREALAQSHSTAVEYAIGNLNGALIPFAFACFLMRKRWVMLTALCTVSMLFYPVTLTKTSLLIAPALIFMAILSSRFEARLCVIASLLIPAIVGLIASGKVFMLFNFRMLAVPANSLDHYFAFFYDHPITSFCQISLLKPWIDCPYTDQLGIVLANQYHLGNMNASLFATEGVASVGPEFAPWVALICGLVIALANKISAGLSQRFVLISGAVIPHTLLDVPLSTTLLSNGLGLLMLLWFVTPFTGSYKLRTQ